MVLFENVSKRFILRHERSRSFQEAFINIWNRRNRTREEFWAIRDVSFEVGERGTFGIIGENGSGKSTALKLITRIIDPTSGRVKVQGKVAALLELGAGFHQDLSGRENIFLNGSILGMTDKEMKARFDEIVEFSELERFIDTPVKHYSSGMYTRLGFAVAISVDPDILVIDEVLSVGDEAFQRKCIDKIREIKERGKSIILVSHNLQIVKDLCAEAIWLEAGAARAQGPSHKVVDEYLQGANRKNKARLEGAQGKGYSDAEETRRWGTREVEITAVEFLNGAGLPETVFDTGDSMLVRMRYRAKRRVEKPVFGIAIHRADNLHINGPNTKTSDYPIEWVEGEGIVEYLVPSLPFLEGSYRFSAVVYDYSCIHPYDHHDRMYIFTVQPKTMKERNGFLHIPCQWRLESKLTVHEDRAPTSHR